MSSLSRDAAAEVIASIREQNGYLPPDIRQQTPREALKALAVLQRKVGAATKRYMACSLRGVC